MAGSFVTILCAELTGGAPEDRLPALGEAVAHHGGDQLRSRGEGLTAAFPSAASAVACALAMQRAIGAAGDTALGIGLEAGETPPGEGDRYGTSVLVAERLSELAEPGQILV